VEADIADEKDLRGKRIVWERVWSLVEGVALGVSLGYTQHARASRGDLYPTAQKVRDTAPPYCDRCVRQDP
jgi:hypothetical protein